MSTESSAKTTFSPGEAAVVIALLSDAELAQLYLTISAIVTGEISRSSSISSSSSSSSSSDGVTRTKSVEKAAEGNNDGYSGGNSLSGDEIFRDAGNFGVLVAEVAVDV